jgi:Uma2 family endonuclease
MSVAAGKVTVTGEPVRRILARLYRFSVEQYQRMSEAGVLTARDRVELLEGWIVEKMTQNPPHAAALDCAQEVLRPLLPPGWYLREQKPIVTPDSQPEPDLAVVRGPTSRYRQNHPRTADIGFVVDVADTSLEDDRTHKGRLYARARIAVYWIINLEAGQVEVYTQPRGGKSPAYRQQRSYKLDESVPLLIAGQVVSQVPVRKLMAWMESNA